MRVDSWVLSRVGSRPPYNDIFGAFSGNWCLVAGALCLGRYWLGSWDIFGRLGYGEDGG